MNKHEIETEILKELEIFLPKIAVNQKGSDPLSLRQLTK